jgi:hypothetical protein
MEGWISSEPRPGLSRQENKVWAVDKDHAVHNPALDKTQHSIWLPTERYAKPEHYEGA